MSISDNVKDTVQRLEYKAEHFKEKVHHLEHKAEHLADNTFFQNLQNPGISSSIKADLRTIKLTEFLNKYLSSAAAGDLGRWGDHIMAELRSGANQEHILQEVRSLAKVEQERAEFGHSALRYAHGYSAHKPNAEVEKIEAVEIADVRPDTIIKPNKVTKNTQEAYDEAKTAKAKKGHSMLAEG